MRIEKKSQIFFFRPKVWCGTKISFDHQILFAKNTLFVIFFMAYETSYSVFEIRSIGNIRKTESEYLTTEYLKTLVRTGVRLLPAEVEALPEDAQEGHVQEKEVEPEEV